MSYEAEPGDSDLRRRAAWLLAMLVVVAALVVALMVWLLRPADGKNNDAGPRIDDPGSASVGPSSPGLSSPGPSRRSGTTTSRPADPSTSAATKVPKPNCPGNATCTVTGDISGASAAINAYRAKNGKKPVPATTSNTADMCALSSGSDCPSSFVWVHVDDLSGKSVVQSVLGYNSSNDLLDNTAKSFQIGWAYDPQAKTAYCAVIRVD